MGHVTDNTRSRYGRRHPYFLIGAPLRTALGFVPDAEPGPDTVRGLRLLYGGTPLGLTAIAALTFSRDPLTRAAYADVQRQLAGRRARVRDEDA